MFPAFPFFFIGNATFQGLKKAIIVMYMTIIRWVIVPLSILIFVFKFYNESYILIFISILIGHWLVAILYYVFSKNKINSILS